MFTSPAEGTIPLYKFYSNPDGDNTLDTQRIDVGFPDYQLQGTYGHIYPPSGTREGMKKLYSIWFQPEHNHIVTASEYLINFYRGQGATFTELGYIFP